MPVQNVIDFLTAQGLITPDITCEVETLEGGVSSDICKVTFGGESICVKSALARLKTQAVWEAPVSRNATEVAWFRFVGGVLPKNVPKILAHDPKAGLFAMEYFPQERFKVWKSALLSGEVDAGISLHVGRALGMIHAASAGRIELAPEFDVYNLFTALRVDPYLLYLKKTHRDLEGRIDALTQSLVTHRKVLIHGDISPKNILIGSDGPVFLDAETACFGDPAFDAAFCLNHLLLKMVKVRGAASQLQKCFESFCQGYFSEVNWESASSLKTRVAELLPALGLARIDGKSPVEYITDDRDKDEVRKLTRDLLTRKRTAGLSDIAKTWKENFG